MTEPAVAATQETRGRASHAIHGPPVRHLYVHAPFCARRCFYCDFAVHVDPEPSGAGPRSGDDSATPGQGGGTRAWLAALAGELASTRREGVFALAPRLRTLYVGGGTPSLLGPESMNALRSLLGETRFEDPDLEWTGEANPESFDLELAEAWRRAGVNRLSLGQQSFHEPTLRWMGRLHGSEGGARALSAARDAGFDNVSIDLMFGLPRRLGRDWTRDLDKALALEPEHVSLYGLAVEERTPLGRAVAEGKEAVADEERYREEYLEAAETLARAGYDHYELSNFALEGRQSRHNSACWLGSPYLGIGNGAHSYAHPLRRWNEPDWEEYHRRAIGGDLPEAGRELLTPDAERLEQVWLALRTRRGLELERAGGGAARESARQLIRRWQRHDRAVVGAGRVRLTPKGWLLLDSLAVELAELLR